MSLEGSQLGRYHLLQLLGRGAMGEVYLAEDATLPRQVAIKVIRRESSLEPALDPTSEAIGLFQHEMQMIARLTHPHILPLYDYGEAVVQETLLPYMVMPLCPDGSLAAWVKQRGQPALLSPREIAHLLQQAAAALQYAHDQHIVHRDVKPSNFLIRHTQEEPNCPDLLLADFGLARFSTASRSQSLTIGGTPPYMAPEQWRGWPVPASDQYMLAVMVYELLTGRTPFLGSLERLLVQHLQEPPEPPSRFNPQLPLALNSVVLQALSKQPEARFPGVAAFARAFEQALRQDSGSPACDAEATIGIHVPLPLSASASHETPSSATAFSADSLASMANAGEIFEKTPEVPPPALPFKPRNPYKGLRAFQGEDAGDFFGREQLIDELLEKLKTILAPKEASRLLAVIGPSGSGKSSVLMAGLLPHLQAGDILGSERWVYLNPMVPGRHPIESLVVTLGNKLTGRGLISIREDLQDEQGRGLHLLAASLATKPEAKVVLVVDQFEELFTQAIDEQERKQFIDVLVTAATEQDGPLLVILTLRADFYDRPMYYMKLGKIIEEQSKSVFPMNMKELQAVIEQPAALPDVQLTFEEHLVQDLLIEVQGQSGALPLLQFTLDQLFQRRQGSCLTRRAYEDIEGVKGALCKHAEATYTALPSEEHRRLARALFLRLIDPGVTEQDTRRRRATLAELTLPNPKETMLLQQVARAFLDARLLTSNESADRIPTLEVSHEALIREWTSLADWLRQAREDIVLQQAISKDVAEWERRGEPKDRLYRGSQLAEAIKWAKRNAPSHDEMTFLQASSAQRTLRLAGLIVVVLLLVSSIGIAGWSALVRPPDPTLVTTLQDNVNGSLRYCINNAPAGSTITFASSLRGAIELTGGNLVFAGGRKLTIRGPGADRITISGGDTNANILVSKGAMISISGLSFKDSKTTVFGFLYNEGTLTVANSIISNNEEDATNSGYGGGIYNYTTGMLTIINSTISSNRVMHNNVGEGGGIDNQGTLTVTSSTISNNSVNSGNSSNSSISAGGGIYNSPTGTIWLTSCTISNNTASGSTQESDGGGIDNYGKLTVSSSTFSKNTASGSAGNGGGIYNYTAGIIWLDSSAISNNLASGLEGNSYGGGINNGGTLTVFNSTLSNNKAVSNTISRGGGIWSFTFKKGTFAIIHFSTIYGNTSKAGGGIWVDPTGSSNMTISSSIVVANSAHDGPDISGSLTSDGYNLLQNLAGVKGLDSTTDRQVTLSDLKLDPMLGNNGGPTQTLALLQGSQAIDVVPRQACSITVTDAPDHTVTITTDQRGDPRPDGLENACDIGAYESSY